jgi:hypothetical protein
MQLYTSTHHAPSTFSRNKETHRRNLKHHPFPIPPLSLSHTHTLVSFSVLVYHLPRSSMESKKRMSMVVALVVLLGLVGSSAGAVFKVGDSAGWTTMGNVNYGLWTSAKTFTVGDIAGEFSNFSVTFLFMHQV